MPCCIMLNPSRRLCVQWLGILKYSGNLAKAYVRFAYFRPGFRQRPTQWL